MKRALLLAALCSLSAWATITRDTTTSCSPVTNCWVSNPGAGATVTVSGYTACVGCAIIVDVFWCDNSFCSTATATGDITSVSNGTDTFTQSQVCTDSGSPCAGIYPYGLAEYMTPAAAGGSHSITLTLGSSTPFYAAIYVHSWNYTGSGFALDQKGSGGANAGSTSPTATTTGNLTASTELIIGFFATGNAASAGSGYSIIFQNGSSTESLEEQIGGTAGATFSANVTQSASQAVGIICTYKETGGTAPNMPPSVR